MNLNIVNAKMTISINDLDNQNVVLSTTILNGTSLSGIIDCQGFCPIAVITPTAWTAASLTAQGSIDGITFFPILGNTSTQLVLCTAIGTTGYQLIVTTSSGFIGNPLPRYIKLRSGTDAVPVNQLADRAFTIILQPNLWRKP